MASPASRTVPTSSPNSAVHDPPRSRDRNNLKAGGQDSALRGINRGKVTRGGGVRGGRGAPTNLVPKSVSHPDTPKSAPSLSPTAPSAPQKPPVSVTAAATPKASSKAVDGSAERDGRPKAAPRKQSRVTPVVVVAPSSPSQASQTAPPTPSRSASRRRRLPPGKGPTTPVKPLSLPNTLKAPNSRVGVTLASQANLRKDVPSHLAAAHEAEIRHDIDVLVERVRAVAMAENRPTTPGSHIDWAGDEDDSLPDLDDWGVTTTHTSATHHENQNKEISPILVDTLKPLPEPNSDVLREEGQETERCDVEPGKEQESLIEPSFLPSPTTGTTTVLPATEGAPEQSTAVPMTAEELSSSTVADGKPLSHPSLPRKPTAAVESLRARSRSISKLSNLPPRPDVFAEEEALNEGLSESVHAPSADECLASERVSSATSSERGLAASIHAPASGLPESHSAPSLLSTHPPPGSRAHSRSQTEGHAGAAQSHTSTSHRRGRSGAASPLGKHASAHSRNYSTPAGGVGSRLPQTSRPVITGEAISRLARTIGGLESNPRSRTIPVTKDSTIS